MDSEISATRLSLLGLSDLSPLSDMSRQIEHCKMRFAGCPVLASTIPLLQIGDFKVRREGHPRVYIVRD